MMNEAENLAFIRSKDGATIAYARAGTGPPVVLVPGANGHHRAWDHVLPFLTPYVTTYAMARRGRGPSTETDPSVFDLGAEVGDVLALIAEIGRPVHLVGHSSGAVVALEAARLAPGLLSLSLYEPRFGSPSTISAPRHAEKLQAMLLAGDRDDVIAAVMRDDVGMGDEIEFWRASPSWPRLEAIAHIFVREITRLSTYRFDAERFRRIDAPVLLFAGEVSPAHFQEATALLRSAFPDAGLVTLPGERHNAIVSSPEAFARALLAFVLREP